MPNQWEEFAKGLIAGGTNFASGLMERSSKNQAEEQYQTGRKYIQDQYQSLLDSNKRLIDKANTNIGNDNEVLTQNKNVSLLPVDQQVQDSYEKIFAQTQTGLNDVLMKLKNNKYGQEYAKGLEQLYGQLFSRPEYQIIQGKDNSIMAINKRNLQIKELKSGTDKEKNWTYQDITTDNPDGSQTVTQYAIDKNNPDNKKNLGTYTIPKKELKSGVRSRGYRGSGIKTLDNITVKEKEIHSDLENYRKYEGKDDEKSLAEKQRLQDKYTSMGMSIDDLNNEYEYTGKDIKKQKDFLQTKVKTSEQINDAYNQTYDDIGMDNWWRDLESASGNDDFNGKVGWYENYLQTEIKPQVTSEIYRMLWSEFQKAKANIYNYKRYWEY